MEIVIIVLLLASLFGVWLLSVRRKLETQEENIRNAMYQTLVQLSAEREALEGLAEFLGQTMDAETFRRMKHSLESAQTAGEAGLPEWVAEQQRELLRVQKKIAEILEGMPLLQADRSWLHTPYRDSALPLRMPAVSVSDFRRLDITFCCL